MFKHMFWTGIVLQTRGLSRELAKNCVTLDMGVSVSARSAVPQFFYPKYLIEHLITLTSAGKKKSCECSYGIYGCEISEQSILQNT